MNEVRWGVVAPPSGRARAAEGGGSPPRGESAGAPPDPMPTKSAWNRSGRPCALGDAKSPRLSGHFGGEAPENQGKTNASTSGKREAQAASVC
jgi:hypothetical protein